MSKSRRTVKRSVKSGTVKRIQVRAAAKEIERERKASSGPYVSRSSNAPFGAKGPRFL